MSAVPSTLDYVRGALLTLGGVLLLALAIIGLSLQDQFAAHRAQHEATQQRDENRAKLAHAAQEAEELRAKISHYLGLVERGVVGPERRLDWIETISRVRRERQLSDLDYEIAPQREVERSLLPGGAQVGGLRFMASTVRLHGGLLHEGDLVGLLDDLRHQVPAHTLLRGCQILRAPAGGAQALRIECELDWITLQGGGK